MATRRFRLDVPFISLLLPVLVIDYGLARQ